MSPLKVCFIFSNSNTSLLIKTSSKINKASLLISVYSNTMATSIRISIILTYDFCFERRGKIFRRLFNIESLSSLLFYSTKIFIKKGNRQFAISFSLMANAIISTFSIDCFLLLMSLLWSSCANSSKGFNISFSFNYDWPYLMYYCDLSIFMFWCNLKGINFISWNSNYLQIVIKLSKVINCELGYLWKIEKERWKKKKSSKRVSKKCQKALRKQRATTRKAGKFWLWWEQNQTVKKAKYAKSTMNTSE